MYLRTWFALILSLFLTSGGAAPAGFDPSSLLGLNLVTGINVLISLESLTDNLVTVNFNLKNSLLIPLVLVINQISSDASVNGTVFATFSHTFNSPLVINPGQTINSGNIDNVLLTQGALNSLQIIPGGILDILSNVTVFDLIPIDGLSQKNVPTNFTLDLAD